MKKMVLHIGAPKCASSTIQKYLGEKFADLSDVNPSEDRNLRYACLKEDGRIFWGRRLYTAQKLNVMGYESSVPFSEMTVPFHVMIRELSHLFESGSTVVLSCEGWAADSCLDSVKNTLEELNIEVDVFFVTRPPIEWMNSAWWQWGIWGGEKLEEWVRAKVDVVNFWRQLNFWSSLSVVGRVQVCDLSQNPLYLFQDFIGAPREDVRSINLRTSPALLEHLLNNKERHNRTIHNPEVEFKIGSMLRPSDRRLPSVIGGELADFVIRRFQEDNIELVKEIERSSGPLSSDVSKKYVGSHAAVDFREVGRQKIATSEERNELISELIDRLMESRDFSSKIENFDPSGYLELNPDVRESGMNPFEHYLRFGIREDRVY